MILLNQSKVKCFFFKLIKIKSAGVVVIDPFVLCQNFKHSGIDKEIKNLVFY